MKKFLAITFFTLSIVSAVFLMPKTTSAASALLVDCKYGEPISGTNEKECAFLDVIAEIKLLINFAFIISVPITVIAITVAGVKILLAQGNPGKVSEAKKLLTQVIVGFIFILSAWLIVYTITSQLLNKNFNNPFLENQNSN